MLIEALRSLAGGSGLSIPELLMQLLAVACIVFFVTPLHELAHGFVAYKLGDSTAKQCGRLTLNPLASLDPVGALGILLFGIGWAKPVPVNPYNFRHPKRDMAITAIAGPVSNLIAAFVGAVFYLILECVARSLPSVQGASYQVLSVLFTFFYFFVSINLSLAVFNLIPVPPLDGSRLVAAALPDRIMRQYYRYERILVGVLFLILLSDALDSVLWTIQNALWDAVFSVALLPFQALGLL